MALWDVGVPTAASLWEVRDQGMRVVAGGGLRTGLDIARALAFGADYASVAQPFVAPALASAEACVACVRQLEAELRTAMYLFDAPTVARLQTRRCAVVGELAGYIAAREAVLRND